MTTTRITHASPAGLYAKAANRNWERDEQVTSENVDIGQCRDIAHQLVHHYPGNELKVSNSNLFNYGALQDALLRVTNELVWLASIQNPLMIVSQPRARLLNEC